MARYESKAQALVDYAGVIGSAVLRDPAGRTIAQSYPPSPQIPWGAHRFKVPGAICKKGTRHDIKHGGYTLELHAAAGVSPYAVTARIEGCKKLLRAMGEAPFPFDGALPHGGGGNGPANAELRVWPTEGVAGARRWRS